MERNPTRQTHRRKAHGMKQEGIGKLRRYEGITCTDIIITHIFIGGDRDARIYNTVHTEENLGNVTTQTHMQTTDTYVKYKHRE